MGFQTHQGIFYHFFPQFRFQFYFNQTALRIRIAGFVFFRFFLQLVYNFYFLVYKVIAVNHNHHKQKNKHKEFVVRLNLVPVQKISLYNIDKGEFLLWLVCHLFFRHGLQFYSHPHFSASRAGIFFYLLGARYEGLALKEVESFCKISVNVALWFAFKHAVLKKSLNQSVL